MFNGFGIKNNPFASAIKNIFSPQQTQQNGGTQPLTSTIPGYPFAPYQVQSGDTFDSIAKNNSLSLDSVKSANKDLLVPPPSGSYVNLPVGPALPSGYDAGATLQGVPVSARPTSYNPQYYGPQAASNATGTNTPNASPYPDNPQVQASIDQIISAGGLPDRVPFGAKIINPQTGAPVTFQQMMQNGYTFRAATNEWVLSTPGGVSVTGAPNNNTGLTGAPSTDLEAIQSGKPGPGFKRVKASEDLGGFYAQNNAFLNAKRWDPSDKKFKSIGQLIREGKLDVRTGRSTRPRGGGGGKKKKKPIRGAGETPAQQLDTNQGGG